MCVCVGFFCSFIVNNISFCGSVMCVCVAVNFFLFIFCLFSVCKYIFAKVDILIIYLHL